MGEDIFDILVAQNTKAEQTLAALVKIPAQRPAERRRMGQELARDLIPRIEAEAQVLDKRLAQIDELRDAVARHHAERERIGEAVWRLLNIDPDDPDWAARLSELTRDMKSLFTDEENHLFPEARKWLDKDEAKDFGEVYISLRDRRKHQVQPG